MKLFSDNPSAQCQTCGQTFQNREQELRIYSEIGPQISGKQFSIPTPKDCPRCRQQNRLAFRNERNLYNRKCDFSGQPCLSVHSPDKTYPVYNPKEWWGDGWDASAFARSFDSTRSFFEQFDELRRLVPTQALTLVNCENSDYNNNLANSKNCYLVFGSVNCEDTFYSSASINLKDCLEIWWSNTLELCMDIFCSSNLFDSLHCDRCTYSSNIIFCRDCSHCTHCFDCVNLHHKEYCISNVQFTKEEYFKTISQFNHGSYSHILNLKSQVDEHYLTNPYQAITSSFSEECLGDMIYESRDCYSCFTIVGCESGSYLFECGRNINCTDMDFSYDCTGSVYAAVGSTVNFNCAFLVNSHYSTDSYYLNECLHVTNCFGCVGLRNKEYCIFNKQYTKDKYFAELSNILTHMERSKEWGEFFPVQLSQFGYNESDATLLFPLTKEQARSKNARWSNYEKPEPRAAKIIAAADLPDHINDVKDDIVDYAITCAKSGKLFRIASRELQYYRRLQAPLPRIHPDERYLNMLKRRNPLKLWNRSCSSCKKPTPSTYNPEQKEIIYCEPCYREAYL